MPVTNAQSGTRIDEIEDGIYRISTPVPPNPTLPTGFTFNQYLVEKLRWVSFSHFEADECGALNEWLAAAPNAAPLCGRVGAMISVNDFADRPARALDDGETITIGKKQIRYFYAPHLPHGWDAGYIADVTTRTLFCGDLFTQPGSAHDPLTESDILGPSQEMRKAMDYYAHAKTAATMIERFALTEPRTLACMHGAAFRGDGARALRDLAQALGS